MTLKDAVYTGSREKLIGEGDFLPLLEKVGSHLFSLREIVREGTKREWSRRFVSVLIRDVHTLRTLLNDYEAQENRTYAYFTELVAGVRGFAKVLYILKHMKERFLRSPVAGDGAPADFVGETERAASFCGDTLRSLFSALLDDCGELGIELPPPVNGEITDENGDVEFRKHLPHNIDEEEMAGEDEKIAQVAANFLRTNEKYESIVPRERLGTYQELKEYVQRHLDEEKARKIESQIHAIQSRYDTYVQYTQSEAKNPELRRLRYVISLVLHLFQATTHLVHFYERHENDIRSERVKERVARCVDKRAVLDCAVNFAFCGAKWLMDDGARTAHRLIPEYTSIQTVEFAIPRDVRLHIRPAALIAAIVNHHQTPVRMKMGDGECDAASVTDVIFLAGTNLDARHVTFTGDERPVADLRALFEVGLRDEGREELEERLPYLKRRQSESGQIDLNS